jgi:serine/threonine protein kinase/formylglycine-generating enzyme required for sulfatase activity
MEEERRKALLRELVAVEIQLRIQEGERPSPADYFHRFPADFASIEAAFVATDAVDVSSRVDRPGSTSVLDAPPAEPPQADLDASRVAMEPGPSTAADPTVDITEQHPTQAHLPDAGPQKIGRYAVLGHLGDGGFARVYLGRDEELNRMVAIKVPRRETFSSSRQLELFLNDARMTAMLRHPAIVAIYDIGRRPDGSVYIVLEYVEGREFSEAVESGEHSRERLIAILVRVAEAVHHAHKRGIVHRDLKPSNILIDSEGNPRVADFGLAVHEDSQRIQTGEVAGTIPYMAPEQVRGETHRQDGRTDIWAIGVMLYTILTGRRPFSGDRDELLDEICHRDPKPPRQINDAIPKELERIALKCLSKRMVDRYTSALDLAEDLSHWLSHADRSVGTQQPGVGLPQPGHSRVVPRGLRSFDENDADFFLELLPGPRDRHGLPESIRFWKSKIEQPDPDKTFRVGLIYGPSGCGKSSLVKAGLLPRLDKNVLPLYIEATAEETESRLRNRLRKVCAGLPTGLGLVDSLASIRDGGILAPNQKLLIIIDQFEQWLHAKRSVMKSELVSALRQCDAAHIQAVVMVRDDFWMASTRFMSELEIRLLEGENSLAVDLFDHCHARKVLTAFGSAFGALPESIGQVSRDQEAFIEQSVRGLEQGGKVVPVRLALFVEMVKGKPWSTATLRQLGGIQGIGVTFLEESFNVATAPPEHRLHQKAALGVLKALLPESGTDIKGQMRSEPDLRTASGYIDNSNRFFDLVHILGNELRLITPTDPEGSVDEQQALSARERYYQLSHDYLVPALREWLNRKQRETRRGRATLRLATITSLWKDCPESRRLPSLLEWIEIVGFTRSATWSTDERRMMRATTRHLFARLGLAICVVAAGAFALNEFRLRERSTVLLSRAVKAEFQHVPELLPDLAAHWPRVLPALEHTEKNPATTDRDRTMVSLLLFFRSPTELRAASLRTALRAMGPDEVAVIRDILAMHPAEAGATELVREFVDESTAPACRLRIACALAKLRPDEVANRSDSADALTLALLAEDRRSIPHWLELLRPSLRPLADALFRVCRDSGNDATLVSTAAEALGEALVLSGDSAGLGRAVVETPFQASIVLNRDLLRLERAGPALEFMHHVLEDKRVGEPPNDVLASWKANAAIGLAGAGEPERLWPLLEHDPDPRPRTLLIQYLGASRLDLNLLIERMVLEQVGPVERQALLLVFAETPSLRVPSSLRARVIDAARTLRRTAPDAASFSAAELLLRRWGQRDEGTVAVAPLTVAQTKRRSWPHRLIGPNGHIFAVLQAPLQFWMGSPENESGRSTDEKRHFRRIDRTIAVATCELTIEQFRKFRPDSYAGLPGDQEPGYAANYLSWFDTVAYCNWLSRESGIARDQWCYPEHVSPGIEISPSATVRFGYRLPTEAEWEYFCRSGTETSRPYGESENFLSRYGWTWLNSGDHTHRTGELLPNEFGLFDLLGNVWEWCHDGPRLDTYERPPYPDATPESPAPDHAALEKILESKTWRFIRGGAYDYTPSSARSAHRDVFRAENRAVYVGMRVVRTLPDSER